MCVCEYEYGMYEDMNSVFFSPFLLFRHKNEIVLANEKKVIFSFIKIFIMIFSFIKIVLI